jgi:hypothetical protein
MGYEIDCAHYATAIEILGQGVQTRVFRVILGQIAGFMSQNHQLTLKVQISARGVITSVWPNPENSRLFHRGEPGSNSFAACAGRSKEWEF